MSEWLDNKTQQAKSDYPQEHKGSLFINDFKDHAKKPDYKGEIKWNGEVIEIGAWKSETREGRPYLSLKLSEPYTGPRKSGGSAPKSAPKEDNPFI